MMDEKHSSWIRSSFYFCQFLIVIICHSQAPNSSLLYHNSWIQLPLKYIYCWLLASSPQNNAQYTFFFFLSFFIYHLVRKSLIKLGFASVLTDHGRPFYTADQRMGENFQYPKVNNWTQQFSFLSKVICREVSDLLSSQSPKSLEREKVEWFFKPVWTLFQGLSSNDCVVLAGEEEQFYFLFLFSR